MCLGGCSFLLPFFLRRFAFFCCWAVEIWGILFDFDSTSPLHFRREMSNLFASRTVGCRHLLRLSS